MSSAADFKGNYSPGGAVSTPRTRARYAGVRSGVARRRLSRQRRGLPAGARLPLGYKIRLPTREHFDRSYEAAWPRPERPSAEVQWERKREAVWQHAVSSARLVQARGQHCGTTRGRRAVGLAKRGHPRCDRTIYTYNQALEELGLATFRQVRTPAGARDFLRVEWRLHRRLSISPCRQPCGTGNYYPFGVVPRSSNSSIPPPPAADDEPPGKPAERPATREEEIRAELRFVQLKLDSGLGDPEVLRLRLARLRAQEAHARRSPEPDGSGSDG